MRQQQGRAARRRHRHARDDAAIRRLTPQFGRNRPRISEQALEAIDVAHDRTRADTLDARREFARGRDRAPRTDRLPPTAPAAAGDR